MSDSTFAVTSRCNAPPADNVVLFPPGKCPPKGARVLLTTTDKKKKVALKGGKRSDAGAAGLCLSQVSIDKLGGEDALVNARGLRLLVAIFHDLGLFLNAFAAILIFSLTVLTAISGYTSVGTEDPPTALKIAPWIFGIGCLIAAVRLYKSVQEA
jgi:hypothetical protein